MSVINRLLWHIEKFILRVNLDDKMKCRQEEPLSLISALRELSFKANESKAI